MRNLCAPVLVCVALAIFCGIVSSSAAQGAEQKIPLLIAGELPLYPPIARAARVQGIVKVKVTTDGKNVSLISEESGPQMLVKSAKEKILTWKFVDHKPTTFMVTFHYSIEEPYQCGYGNGAMVLHLPREARITVKGLKTCDPAAF
jgi:hypothetical protein